MQHRHPAPWTRHDLQDRQRQRWRTLARAEAQAAEDAGADEVASLFNQIIRVLDPELVTASSLLPPKRRRVRRESEPSR